MNEFSVVQFFEDETSEYVRRNISAEAAVMAARTYTANPAAKIGIIRRVIITDGNDCTVFEWRFGEGVIFPPR